MRYRETGELHLDFHISTFAGINYVLKNYGMSALEEIFEKTGTQVYKEINEELKAGKTKALEDFWQYFFEREKADFSIIKRDGQIILTVNKCPAVTQIKERGFEFNENCCLQTTLLNAALCKGSDFEITTEKKADASCVQILKLREGKNDTK